MKKNVFMLSTLLLASSAVLSQPFEVTNNMTDGAVNIVKQLTNSQNVVYFNAASLLKEGGELQKLTLQEIEQEVVGNKNKYLLDFSSLTSPEQKQRALDKVSKITGISFEQDFLVISAFKGSLLYTPVSSPEDPNVSALETANITTLPAPLTIQKRQGSPQAIQKSQGSPALSFYVSANRPISDGECSFSSGQLWGSSEKSVYCDTPNISLIYKVDLLRSLPVKFGSQTAPDKKLVRVTLAGESRGSGIHLNDSIDRTLRFKPGNGSTFDGWVGQYTYDAIALDYKVGVSSSNGKARVIYKYPTDNVQSNYEHREVEGFTIGGTTGVEVSKDGPKAKLEANASYSSQKWFSYKTTDYAIKLSTPNDRTFVTTWQREEYKSANDLRTQHTQELTSNVPSDIINKSLIKPIGYSNFTPQMEVFYAANSDETGKTSFTIDTSVNFSPIRMGIYRHFIGIGAWRTFQGSDFTPKRVNVERTFKVNWDHAIFLGGNPVNLQMGAFKNKCISVDHSNNGTIALVGCDRKDTKQSFIYDELGRYVSVDDISQCLDGDDLSRVSQCTPSLTQQWDWNDDLLKNEYDDRVLSAKTKSNTLFLSSNSSERGGKNRTFTFSTNIYDIGKAAGFCNIHSWDDDSQSGNVGDVYYYRNPYTKTNDYFRLNKEKYGYFPTDQSSSQDWEYIGNSSCDQIIEI
nr:leukocidin family pore-forming toxin [Moritella viscosa]SHO02204.1 Haemolysin [Moritella viscosa]